MGRLARLLRFGPIVSQLNDGRVEWVTNHGINACRALARIGVRREKILAWDYPHERRPDQVPVRTAPPAGTPDLLYVGTIQPAKGIGDVIHGIAELRRRAVAVTLRVVGGGRIDEFRALAEKLGVDDRIVFEGLVPNDRVFELMRRATAVLVPSRHIYPEGLPITITEALCARAPIIASDHPMFAGHLVHRDTALVFRAGEAGEFADRVVDLISDSALHVALSANAARAWERMQNPVKWGDVLFRWIADGAEDRAWLADLTLALRHDGDA